MLVVEMITTLQTVSECQQSFSRPPVNSSATPSNRSKGPKKAQSSVQGRGKGSYYNAPTHQKSRAPTRIYHIRGREDEESPSVIVGTVELNSSPAYALIDSGSTHSFVCSIVLDKLKMKPEHVESSLVVSNPI